MLVKWKVKDEWMNGMNNVMFFQKYFWIFKKGHL